MMHNNVFKDMYMCIYIYILNILEIMAHGFVLHVSCCLKISYQAYVKSCDMLGPT